MAVAGNLDLGGMEEDEAGVVLGVEAGVRNVIGDDGVDTLSLELGAGVLEQGGGVGLGGEANDGGAGSVMGDGFLQDVLGGIQLEVEGASALFLVGFGMARSEVADGGAVTTSAATTQSLTLYNAGTAPFSVASTGNPFALSGAGFAVAPSSAGGCNFAAPLSVGGSCRLTATFSPTTLGNYRVTLTFTDNASNSPQSLDLVGSYILPTPVATLTA